MTSDDLHLYWANGCTSCLKTKEFLERNDVTFVSHNILCESVFEDLEARGIPRRTPILRREDEWIEPKDMADVAEFLALEYAAEQLPVEELYRRLNIILDATVDLVDLLPDDELETVIGTAHHDEVDQLRSYADLVYHIFSIPDSFLRREAGVPIKPRPEPAWDHNSTDALTVYGLDVRARVAVWFEGPGQSSDWSEELEVYWGMATRHTVFERTTWHAGQHTRQLAWILENKLGIAVDDPIDPAVWTGLPMPEQIWDDSFEEYATI